jgi:hypothetical protein
MVLDGLVNRLTCQPNRHLSSTLQNSNFFRIIIKLSLDFGGFRTMSNQNLTEQLEGGGL